MIRLVQNSFFGGQLDYEMMGRQDYQRYAKGATKLCNFNIMKRGGLDKRRGFDRILNLTEEFADAGVNKNTKFRAIPFAWQKSHGFVLLMSEEICIVVGTIPRRTYGYYEVSGIKKISDTGIVYNATSIQELDYQQCGDVMFIAHPDFPPAKITHTYDETNGHRFVYSTLDLSSRYTGIPTINSAYMSRLSVKGNIYASIVTESYRASALFDGVETMPCNAFSQYNPGTPSGSGDESQDVTGASTTAYRAPWTQSQKIRLNISVPIKITDDTIKRPESIYIYKKAFNYFGLIGSVDVSSSISKRFGPVISLCNEEDSGDSSWTIKIGDIIPDDNRYGDLSETVDADVATTANNSVYVESQSDNDALLNNAPYSLMRKTFGWKMIDGYGASGLILNTNVIPSIYIPTIRFYLGGVHCYIMNGYDNTPLFAEIYYKTGSSIGLSFTMAIMLLKRQFATSSKFSHIGKTIFKEITLPYVESVFLIRKGSEGESADSFLARVRDARASYAQKLKDMGVPQYVDIAYDSLVEGAGQSASDSYVLLSPVTTGAIYRPFQLPLEFGGIAVIEQDRNASVVFDDTNIIPDSSKTVIEPIADDSITSINNYPSTVALSQQRLIWASSRNNPQRIWMSEIGDFYSYHTHEIMTASDAIDFQLPITRFGKINHICELRKLLLFNSACEWVVDSASSVEGLTYETLQAYPQSYSGSSERLKPIICNNTLLFCERTGQTVRRFAYDLSNDGFAGRDISILSSSIFEHNNIVDWTYQQFPYSTLWCVLKDGSLASFEYMEEQDIMAWMTHKLGGDGEVISIATSYAVSPALDNVDNVSEYEYATHEEVFAVVKRQDSLWLERMRPQTKTPNENTAPCEDSLYHSLCLDGVRVLNSTNQYQPTEETGAVWIPSDTTDGSTITRDEALAKLAQGVEVYEGFPFNAEYTSVYPNVNNGQTGNGQFDIKHIQGCGLRLMHAYGGKVTPVGSKLSEPIKYYNNDPENDHRAVFYIDGTKKKIRLFNHDTPIMALPGVNNRDGRVTISQNDPYPFSLLSYELDFEPETGGYGA